MILLDERQEVLMLVTNSIKLDINHINPYIAGLAITALVGPSLSQASLPPAFSNHFPPVFVPVQAAGAWRALQSP